MKIAKDEFIKMVEQLSLNKYKTFNLIVSVIIFIAVNISCYIQKEGILISILTSLIVAMIFYFLIKNILKKTSRKINFVEDIVEIEQEIYEEKIVEKVKKKNGTETVSELVYKDIYKIKEDKNNFYLYLNSVSAMIISKNKIEDLNEFNKLINKRKDV